MLKYLNIAWAFLKIPRQLLLTSAFNICSIYEYHKKHIWPKFLFIFGNCMKKKQLFNTKVTLIASLGIC